MAADAAAGKQKESLPHQVDNELAELLAEIQALKQACLESKVYHQAILAEMRCTSISCMRGFDNIAKLLEKIEKKL